MGWTVTKYDTGGRLVSKQHFDASGLPAPWGSNGNTSGAVTTSYNGYYTTVTDEAGHARVTQPDGLGRLTAVWEDPSGFNYATSYQYDVLDDLTQVAQGSETRTFNYDSLKRLSSAANPESGTVSYTYDANANLLTKKDARNITTTYSYDALNRKLGTSYSDGTPASAFAYDGAGTYSIGRLTSESNANSAINYTSYDALGRVTASNQQTVGWTYSFAYSYNLPGSLTSETYPSGRVLTTSYDGANRANQAVGSPRE